MTCDREWWRAVGPRIRKLRQARGQSQLDVARLVGVTQASVSNYEAGKRQVTVSLAQRFASALEVPLGELLPLPNVVVLEPGSRLAEAALVLAAEPDTLRRVLGDDDS